MLKILAVIPARAGSKRLPGKNIKDLCGKPLISWSIDSALEAPSISKVVVSTDCEKIADIARASGADVPYLRSPELSSDMASSVDVVLDMVNHYARNGVEFDAVMLLQPTSPLRETSDIESAVSLYVDKKAEAVISVTPCEHSPLWCNQLPGDQSLKGFIPESIKSTRSQDLAQYYRLNGAVYLISTATLQRAKAFFIDDDIYALVMDRKKSVDIDEQIDFLLADLLIKNNI
ncbi:acylneuraminate cytidylyltransferase family protein [Providencia hangzhouensis]